MVGAVELILDDNHRAIRRASRQDVRAETARRNLGRHDLELHLQGATEPRQVLRPREPWRKDMVLPLEDVTQWQLRYLVNYEVLRGSRALHSLPLAATGFGLSPALPTHWPGCDPGGFKTSSSIQTHEGQRR